MSKILGKYIQSVLCFLPCGAFFDCFLSILYFVLKQKRFPNILHPQTFNELLLCIKIGPESYNPLRQFICDKEFVKDFVSSRVGDSYNIKTIAILTCANDVYSYKFQDKCVIKPTHMSAEVILRKSADETLDLMRICKWFSVNYYKEYREPNYRYLQPKVIVEEMLETESGTIPNDYKFFCFHGRPIFVQVDSGRFGSHLRTFFNSKWEPLGFTVEALPSDFLQVMPENFEEMLYVAAILSKPFVFIRVDLYSFNDMIRVGELTSFPSNCMKPFAPLCSGLSSAQIDLVVGKLFSTPEVETLDPLLVTR
ncbi:MAG: hypothetical protein FD177_2245 [Desulfovibrionaceae bacterium]|nr:MAG: hypothetical protein FD177_2245 [Desulfovibrionaceae bacterium]